MKKFLFTCLFLAASPALADGYIMGAGRWTCEKVVAVADGEHLGDYFQMAGWILGFWSRETLDQDTPFIDKVEGIGGQKVFQFTVDACRKVAPETPLYVLTRNIIASSK